MTAAALLAPTRPALRYHGGKWRLAPWVMAHLPAHRTYVEPFGGAASVLLRKPRAYAEVYNDLDGEVVNVFRVLRDSALASQLERALRLTPFSREEFVAAFAPTDDPVERARRAIVRSFHGFGSGAVLDLAPAGMRTRPSTQRAQATSTGFRGTTQRPYTTPAHDWARYPEQIARFCSRLTAVVIEQRPGLDVMRQHDRPDTLHYVDPPYPHDTRTRWRCGGRRHGYAHELSDAQHEELLAYLRGCQGMVVLSSYPNPLYDTLRGGGWECATRSARADGNAERQEVLWLNAAALRALEATDGR